MADYQYAPNQYLLTGQIYKGARLESLASIKSDTVVDSLPPNSQFLSLEIRDHVMEHGFFYFRKNSFDTSKRLTVYIERDAGGGSKEYYMYQTPTDLKYGNDPAQLRHTARSHPDFFKCERQMTLAQWQTVTAQPEAVAKHYNYFPDYAYQLDFGTDDFTRFVCWSGQHTAAYDITPFESDNIKQLIQMNNQTLAQSYFDHGIPTRLHILLDEDARHFSVQSKLSLSVTFLNNVEPGIPVPSLLISSFATHEDYHICKSEEDVGNGDVVCIVENPADIPNTDVPVYYGATEYRPTFRAQYYPEHKQNLAYWLGSIGSTAVDSQNILYGSDSTSFMQEFADLTYDKMKELYPIACGHVTQQEEKGVLSHCAMDVFYFANHIQVQQIPTTYINTPSHNSLRFVYGNADYLTKAKFAEGRFVHLGHSTSWLQFEAVDLHNTHGLNFDASGLSQSSGLMQRLNENYFFENGQDFKQSPRALPKNLNMANFSTLTDLYYLVNIGRSTNPEDVDAIKSMQLRALRSVGTFFVQFFRMDVPQTTHLTPPSPPTTDGTPSTTDFKYNPYLFDTVVMPKVQALPAFSAFQSNAGFYNIYATQRNFFDFDNAFQCVATHLRSTASKTFGNIIKFLTFDKPGTCSNEFASTASIITDHLPDIEHRVPRAMYNFTTSEVYAFFFATTNQNQNQNNSQSTTADEVNENEDGVYFWTFVATAGACVVFFVTSVVVWSFSSTVTVAAERYKAKALGAKQKGKYTKLSV